jgi:uncharacterized protein (UPF0332 family)
LSIKTLLHQKKISRSTPSTDIVVKELDRATEDLEAAGLSLRTGDYKWATIQAYHSMFHAARALLNRMGYREQSHQGLVAALHQLYEKEIVDKMLGNFTKAMTLAQELHDGLICSEGSAKAILENATDSLEQAARILAAPREWFERPIPRSAKTQKR